MHVSIGKICGSIEQSIEYCSKEESRVIPYRSWGVPPQPRPGKRSDLDDAVNYIRSLDGSAAYRMRMLACEHPGVYVKYFKGFWDLCRQLEVQQPLPALPWHRWQQTVLTACLLEPNRRKIHWIYDSVGNRGKSYLSSYLVTNPEYNAIELCGKVADMAYAYNGERVVIFDIVRSQAEHIDHLYDFAERLKMVVFLVGSMSHVQRYLTLLMYFSLLILLLIIPNGLKIDMM